ncbi:hypothetical protein [Rubrimonas cliftonensis]|nr:hypothetical protein [Rubrimonas cliftonensis]
MADTPKARDALTRLVADPANFIGRDRYGTAWYAALEEDGAQIWAQVRGDRIRNGGRNERPRDYFSVATGSAREGGDDG